MVVELSDFHLVFYLGEYVNDHHDRTGSEQYSFSTDEASFQVLHLHGNGSYWFTDKSCISSEKRWFCFFDRTDLLAGSDHLDLGVTSYLAYMVMRFRKTKRSSSRCVTAFLSKCAGQEKTQQTRLLCRVIRYEAYQQPIQLLDSR